MLKIGGAYKIKKSVTFPATFDVFFTTTEFDKILTEFSEQNVGKIFTVMSVFEVSESNFYYPHYRFLILFNEQLLVLIFKNNEFSKNILMYIEEIIE